MGKKKLRKQISYTPSPYPSSTYSERQPSNNHTCQKSYRCQSFSPNLTFHLEFSSYFSQLLSWGVSLSSMQRFPLRYTVLLLFKIFAAPALGFIIFPHPVGIRLGYALWYPTLWKHFTSLPYKTQKWPCDLLWPKTCVTLRWKLKTDLSSLSSQNVPDRGCSISLGPISKVTRSRTIGWTWWVRRNKLML